MAYTTINKPSDYFNTVLYTGNATARDITTGLETTDFIWNKRRDSAGSHLLYDKVRGVNKDLNSESTEAEETQVGTVTAFGTDSFSLGTHGATNGSGESKVTWCWSAGGTTGSSNTDGNITSTVSANTTSGFSIVSYTGTGSTATVGHGLSSAPAMIIIKARTLVEDWIVYHQSTGNTVKLDLNTTNATNASVNYWQNTTPTSSVFYIGANDRLNKSGTTYIAYCFAEKTGYSKFGSYVGNGNADGTFIYTGFKPAFLILKNTSSTGNWVMYDDKRSAVPDANINNRIVNANSSVDYEFASGSRTIDTLSNGFKIRGTASDTNTSGNSYIYMAFAEAPLVGSNGVTAKAR